MKTELPPNTGYTPDHQLEPTEEIDFSKMDAALGWTERGSPECAHYEDAVELSTEGFSKFLIWVWITPTGKPRNPESAKLRFLAATATVCPAIFENQSFNKIAKGMGFTRAAISKLSVEFSDSFGVHFRCSKRQGAREVYAKLAHH